VDGAVRRYIHTPVLPDEVLAYLQCSQGGVFVDATVGEGGHTEAILNASPHNKVIGIDCDREIIERAQDRLTQYGERMTLIHDDFVHLPHILRERGIEGVDGLLFDLGISSFHFEEEKRGFGFHRDGPLDMRMDTRQKLTAYDIVNHFPLKEIETILRRYGEERWAKRITKAIGQERQRGNIKNTGALAEIVSRAIPSKHHPRRIHPATKTFLALRIAVNEELKKLEEILNDAPPLLTKGGRIGIIAFHSLEDRIVKETFKKMGSACICPPDLPQCICGGRQQVLQIITKHPLTPRAEEVSNNPRARSAKLRVAERV
jgi:16S rRNA (cytosine1402-N4)-methyltransferase